VLFFILVAAACTSTATPNNISITFPADEKCTIDGPASIPSGRDITLEVTGHIKEHETVGIAILRLDPGKTIKDLEALKFEDPQPPWTLRVGFYEFPSDGNPHSMVLNQVDGPIYFLCMTPSSILGALGPIEVK
jgi:hypothetical protein